MSSLQQFQKKKEKTCLEKDIVEWKKAKNGILKLKSSFDSLKGGRLVCFPKRMVWDQRVPTKICFSAWEAWWDKVMTLDQLRRRGIPLATRCPLCGLDEENFEHLVFTLLWFGPLVLSLGSYG